MHKHSFVVSLATVAVALFLAGCGGEEAQRLQAENEALRAEVADLRARAEQAETAAKAEAQRLQSDAQITARLRGELTQLRNATNDAAKLRAENQQLLAENQKLRGATATASAPPPTPTPAAPPAGNFPRAAWSNAGYASPEAALVTAIWSMQQGDPKQYFDSLTTEEQLRMSKAWEGKSPEEIAAKHRQDVSAISGMRVLETQNTSPEEVTMNVHIDGVNRTERVSMRRVGNEWRFNGFIR
jgi:hypothetical protein